MRAEPQMIKRRPSTLWVKDFTTRSYLGISQLLPSYSSRRTSFRLAAGNLMTEPGILVGGTGIEPVAPAV